MTDIDRPALLSSVGGAVIDAVALAVCVGALRGYVVEDVVVVDRRVMFRQGSSLWLGDELSLWRLQAIDGI